MPHALVRVIAITLSAGMLLTWNAEAGNAAEEEDYCKEGNGYCVVQTHVMGGYRASGGKVCSSKNDGHCTTCPPDPMQHCTAFGANISYHRNS